MLATILNGHYAKSQNCGMSSFSNQSNNQQLLGLDNYSLENCEALVLKCNLIVLRRDDGTGGIDQSYVNSIVDKTNSILSNITDGGNCNVPPEYPLDAHLRLDFNVIYEDNTSAWDYYTKAKSLDTSYNQNYFEPDSLAGRWPELDAVVQGYKSQFPDRLNIVIVENGGKLDYYENALQNNPNTSVSWGEYDIQDTTFSKIYDGISYGSSGFYERPTQDYIIMANLYTEYFSLKHFGHLERPNSGNTNAELASAAKAQEPFTIVHELGHGLSLSHECDCGKNVMLSRNVTNSSGANCSFVAANGFLTLRQLEEIQDNLAHSSNRHYIDCSKLSAGNCNVVTNRGGTASIWINKPRNIYGDLVIKSGATLEIWFGAVVHFAEESSIDIEPGGKLIVRDGAILTSGCEGETWKGIRVSGGRPGYDVEIKEGAVIENTEGPAVSMFPPNIPWPEVQNHGNGQILASNATFRNCQRMAELIAYSPSENNSVFSNCIQEGGKYGITNWNCQGVQVNDCVFNDISEYCIESYDGNYDLIENNHFYGGTSEILFTNTKPGQPSLVTYNYFYTADIGIRAIGGFIGDLDINFNNFYNKIGIWMEQKNQYLINKNIFENSDYGVICEQNGVRTTNQIINNYFQSGASGILTSQDNDRLTFLNNCFNSGLVDVDIYGSVNLFIGGPAPAGNCFTHKGSSSTNIKDMYGKPDTFYYVEPMDNIENCIDAVEAHQNIEIIEVPFFDDLIDPCFEERPNIPEDPSPCNPNDTEHAYIQAINHLNQEIQLIDESDYSESERAFLLDEPTRCRDRNRSNLFSLLVKSEQFESARQILEPISNFHDAILVYSSFLEENNLDEASSYLDGMEPNNESEHDFVYVQHMNIERLLNGPSVEFEDDRIDYLLDIAEKEQLYAGAAISLYYGLTGILLPPNIDKNNGIGERSIKQDGVNEDINIYPNPVKDLIFVEFNNAEKYNIKITNSIGQNVYSNEQAKESVKINAHLWKSGLYILSVFQGDSLIKNELLIIVK